MSTQRITTNELAPIALRTMGIAGEWLLNHDLSDTSLVTRGEADAHSRSHWARWVVGQGRFSVPPPPEVQDAQMLMRELLEPSPRLTIAPGERDTIMFLEGTVPAGRGVTRTFSMTGALERVVFDAGIAETRTRWQDRWLRQDLLVGGGITVVRLYLPAPESGRLIVTLSVENAPVTRGRPLIHLYESDDNP